MASPPHRCMKITLLSVLSCLCVIMLLASSLLYLSASSSSIILRHFPSFERTRCWSSSLASSLVYANSRPSNTAISSQSLAFGIFSHIYVVSLARRLDRRADMSRLMDGLGLKHTSWSYVDATKAESYIVYDILSSVAEFRSQQENARNSKNFWPADESMLLASENLDTRILPNSLEQEDEEKIGNYSWVGTQNMTCAERDNDIPPFAPDMADYLRLTPAKIACWHSHEKVIELSITQNDASILRTSLAHSLDAFDGSRLQPHQDFAYQGDCIDDTSENSSPSRSRQQLPILVLEDDVDIQRDISTRLSALWPALPRDWDIVFLGHCWSNESVRPAIASYTPSSPLPALSRRWFPLSNHYLWQISGSSSSLDTLSRTTFLHPSSAPKCTHAYALSPRGAHRLLAHLRYKPFAYSRALDQAFAWLVSGVGVDGDDDTSQVENGDGKKSVSRAPRLKAFSIVPSLIVQRKVGKSDVWMAGGRSHEGDGNRLGNDNKTKGSSWKDELWDGVLAATDRKRFNMD